MAERASQASWVRALFDLRTKGWPFLNFGVALFDYRPCQNFHVSHMSLSALLLARPILTPVFASGGSVFRAPDSLH